jgi:hypothetical protein
VIPIRIFQSTKCRIKTGLEREVRRPWDEVHNPHMFARDRPLLRLMRVAKMMSSV